MYFNQLLAEVLHITCPHFTLYIILEKKIKKQQIVLIYMKKCEMFLECYYAVLKVSTYDSLSDG